MKTALIKIYQIYGSKNGFCADVTYRGKLLTFVEGVELEQIYATVKIWARNRRFSHVRMMYDIPAIQRVCTVKI